MYSKDPHEAKYQFLIYTRVSTGLKHFTDPKAYTESSNDMQHVYIEDYNANKERKVLRVFVDMITDLIINKKPNKFNSNRVVY